MKKTILIAGLCCLAGFIIMVVLLIISRGDGAMFDSKDSRYEQREYECREKTDEIYILSSSDSIKLLSGDVDKVKITYWERPGKHEYDLNESGGKLSLTRKDLKNVNWGIYIGYHDTSIVVTVPKDFNGALDLNASSGSVEAKNTAAEYLKIHNSSGSIRVSNIDSQNAVNLKNTSGSIKIDNTKATDVTAENTSGSIKMEDINANGILSAENTSGSVHLTDVVATKDITCKNNSGSINFDRVTTDGSVNAANTSGGVHFESLKAGGNITLKATSGSVKGSIIGKESDYSILSKTTSGGNNLTDSRNGSKELNVNTTSGSIKINFEDF